MPIIKQNKELDGANSIFSASRKLAKRQVKNMKSPVEEEGTTPSVAPVSVDREGLVPQLLQNLNDVNGLMSSLKLLGSGGSDADEPPSPRPRKQLRGGAGRPRDDINKIKEKITRMRTIIREVDEALTRLGRTPSTTETSSMRSDLEERKGKAKRSIARYEKQIKDLELLEAQEESGTLPPSPPPPPLKEDKKDRNAFDTLLKRLNANLETIRDTGAPRDEDIDIDDILRELNRLAPLLNNEPPVGIDDDFMTTRGNRPPKQEGKAPTDTQESQDPIQVIDIDDSPKLPPLPPADEDLDFSNVDFSRIRKSALLVILGQLKGMLKRGELILKKIKQMGIVASEGDLEQIIQDIADIMSSKRYIINHSEEIGNRRGKDVENYLADILNNQLGKYVSSLKTYVKQYAQMNQAQVGSIQEDTEIEGAGRCGGNHPTKGYKPVVLSDAVRRISQYDRKYLL
jgi:ribosomal protein S20